MIFWLKLKFDDVFDCSINKKGFRLITMNFGGGPVDTKLSISFSDLILITWN